jgi:hypothetical protein
VTWREHPGELGDNGVEHLQELPPHGSAIPVATPERHLDLPPMDADASEAGVGDDVVARSGLEREQIGAPPRSNVLEAFVLGEVLEGLVGVVILDGEGARHRRDRTQAAARRKRPRNVQRKGCASWAFQWVMNARTAEVRSVAEENEP